MRDINFCEGWLFHKGIDQTPIIKDKQYSYSSAKTERMQVGICSCNYNEKNDLLNTWENIILPHDYIIAQGSLPNTNGALGSFVYENGYYLKHFTIPKSDKNSRITIYFEGVASKCKVYLNGCFLGENHSAYNSFEFELNPYLNFGGENSITLEITAEATEGWWYAGAGIIRPVWIRKTNLVSIDRNGIYSAPKKVKDKWIVRGEITIRNDDYKQRKITIKHSVDKLNSISKEITLLPETLKTVKLPLVVENPKLWDTENPNLYTDTVEILETGKIIDKDFVKIGFRTAKFKKDEFYLNGRRTRIKGLCCHEDYAITGRVVPYSVNELKLQKFKEIGANGFRCAHYEQSAELMNLLDEYGFLAMAENRRFEANSPSIDYFEAHIKRDRNHPSIILWSTSNEENYHIKDGGKIIQHRLYKMIKKYTDTPVTCAESISPLEGKVYDDLDVIGLNYNANLIDDLANLYPNKPIIMSECVASATTRGWYKESDEKLGFMYGYDNKTYDFGESLSRMEELMLSRPRYSGMYIWDGVEHRGEAVWPRLFSQAGMLDASLHIKDSGYLLKSFWTDKPMVHLLPHWNYKNGEIVDVRIYSNCDEAELFVNGKSQGKQALLPATHGKWNVKFEKGELKAIGYKNGKIVAKEIKNTTDSPYKLELSLENRTPLDKKRNVAVVTCKILDENKNILPLADNEIEFSLVGNGKILGTFGSVCDPKTVVSTTRNAFMGLCSCAVEVISNCTLIANSRGLITSQIELNLRG